MKHRRTITKTDVFMPMRLPLKKCLMYSEQSDERRAGVIAPLQTGQHESGELNCSSRGQVSGRHLWCKQVHVRS